MFRSKKMTLVMTIVILYWGGGGDRAADALSLKVFPGLEPT
jgi:hypothetical protein